MAKPDPELELLKEEMRVVIRKVEARYATLYKGDAKFYQKVHRATKNLLTRVLNGTS